MVSVFLRVLLALALSGTAIAQDPSKLVGRWYSEQRSRGGIGGILELRADGTARFSPAAIVEYKYSFDGQKLVLRYTDPVKGPQPDDVVEVLGLTAAQLKLKIGGATAPPTDWTRSGSVLDGGKLLLGSWTSPREMNGQKVAQNWRFWDNGNAVFTIPFSTQTGTYQLTGGTMKMNVTGQPPVDGPYVVNGDLLTVPGVKSPTKYRRF
jgi:hypothetical protein